MDLLLECYVRQPVFVVCDDEQETVTLSQSETAVRRRAMFWTSDQLLGATFSSHSLPRTVIIWQSSRLPFETIRLIKKRFYSAQVLVR